jgi:hypothetical protein
MCRAGVAGLIRDAAGKEILLQLVPDIEGFRAMEATHALVSF